MAIKTGFNNAKGGGGGSETSGCYLLENASSMTNLYAYTYEGSLRDIDNRNNFPLKNGDTLIGDDGYCYKLMTIDADLGTFTAVQFWKLGELPTIEIEFSQMTSQTTAQLTQDQVDILSNNGVVNIINSDGDKRTYTKVIETSGTLGFSTPIIEVSQTKTYWEVVVDTSDNSVELNEKTISGGKQLYQHNVFITTNPDNTPKYTISVQIYNDDPTQFTEATFHAWLVNNGYERVNKYTEPAVKNNGYPCVAFVNVASTSWSLFNTILNDTYTDNDYALVGISTGGSMQVYTAVRSIITSVVDKVIAL